MIPDSQKDTGSNHAISAMKVRLCVRVRAAPPLASARRVLLARRAARLPSAPHLRADLPACVALHPCHLYRAVRDHRGVSGAGVGRAAEVRGVGVGGARRGRGTRGRSRASPPCNTRLTPPPRPRPLAPARPCSDVDIVVVQNPFDHLYRDSDIEGMSDGFDEATAYADIYGCEGVKGAPGRGRPHGRARVGGSRERRRAAESHRPPPACQGTRDALLARAACQREREQERCTRGEQGREMPSHPATTPTRARPPPRTPHPHA